MVKVYARSAREILFSDMPRAAGAVIKWSLGLR